MEDTFVKRIDLKEFETLKKIKGSEICPKIYLLTENCVIMKRYDFSHKDISMYNYPNIKVKIYDLIMKLHSMGIIHGNIKPENIVCRVKNNKLDVKLVDFEFSECPEDIDTVYIKDYAKRFENEKVLQLSDVIRHEFLHMLM